MIETKHKLQNILERHRGRYSAISRRQLRLILALSESQDRQLRLVIADLRKEGLPVLFATSDPAGYYLPETLLELKEGMDKLRSYIIDECILLRNFKVYGTMYVQSETQGKMI